MDGRGSRRGRRRSEGMDAVARAGRLPPTPPSQRSRTGVRGRQTSFALLGGRFNLQQRQSLLSMKCSHNVPTSWNTNLLARWKTNSEEPTTGRRIFPNAGK